MSMYKGNSFWLIINGNGGFVGQNMSQFIFSFSSSINEDIVFFVLASLTIVFFLLSIQFRISTFFKFIKLVLLFILKPFSLKFNSKIYWR